MNRRNLFAAFAGMFSGSVAQASTAKPIRHVVLNYSAGRQRLPRGGIQLHAGLGMGRSKVLVNDAAIKGVWYVDTFAGIVCTYWVFPNDPGREMRANIAKSGWRELKSVDGKLVDVSHATPEYNPEDFPGREVDCTFNQALSETLRGKVQIVDSVTGELLYGRP